MDWGRKCLAALLAVSDLEDEMHSQRMRACVSE